MKAGKNRTGQTTVLSGLRLEDGPGNLKNAAKKLAPGEGGSQVRAASSFLLCRLGGFSKGRFRVTLDFFFRNETACVCALVYFSTRHKTKTSLRVLLYQHPVTSILQFMA
jgi:hypothetical protein